MAKLIVSHLISLDGFLAGPGGDLHRLRMGPAFDAARPRLVRQLALAQFRANAGRR